MLINRHLTKSKNNTAVALGYFDGLHIGHTAVITETINGSEKILDPTVFTFQKSPKSILTGINERKIITAENKQLILEKMGVKILYNIDFSLIINLDPHQFVKDILVDLLCAKKVYCGFNYRFGRGGEGDSEVLKKICSLYGIGVHITKPRLYQGIPVSSTRIRSLIEDGDVETAKILLGRYFCFDFKVIHGKKLGRLMGTPTINQSLPDNFVLPKFGSYASIVNLGNKTFYGVTNIGIKPTIGSSVPLAETWIPEYNGPDIYGEKITVSLLSFLRKETRFDDLNILKNQILVDKCKAKEKYEELYISNNGNKK